MADQDEISGMDLAELLEQAGWMAAELSRRALDPRLVDELDRFPQGPDEDRSSQWGLYAHCGAEEAGGSSPHVDGVGTGNRDEGVGTGRLDEGVGTEYPAGSGGPEPAPDAGHPTTEVPVPPRALPRILAGVEELGRSVEAARTGLAGHVDRVFDAQPLRREVLGVPEGKCAYRSGADYLGQVLGIHRAEARRRVTRAARIMGVPSLDGGHATLPPLPAVGRLMRESQADPGSVDVIGDALMDARQDALLGGAAVELIDPLLAEGERILTDLARQGDPATVRKATHHWRQRFDALVNPDGAAPTDAQIDARQGIFYHGRGAANLHRWSVLASDAQHERLKTVVSAASNPRSAPTGSRPPESRPEGVSGPQDSVEGRDSGPWSRQLGRADSLDRRSRPQQELDGLVSALTAALALTGADATPDGTSPERGSSPAASADRMPADRVPAGQGRDGQELAGQGQEGQEGQEGQKLAGQLPVERGIASGVGRARPQVLVTIDFETLAGRFERHRSSSAGPPGLSDGESSGRTGRLLSEAAYAGPVDPVMIRQLACEADLIPVVLGGRGEVLGVGRSQRLFSRRLRQALTVRDDGCAAPNCSIPAPWCEAHHIQSWEHRGPTSVQNGVLLCSHHHHAVHAGAWEITVEGGVPWIVPARYQDPDQMPRRNLYWRPGLPDTHGEAA